MADQTPTRAPVPSDGDGHSPLTGPSTREELDANGFDPGEFEWHPVPRRPRADGWTPDVQRAFIQALAETGTVEEACRIVEMSVGSAYRLRHAPGAESFALAWRGALTAAAERLLDVCFERAITGVDEPVFDRDGIRIGSKWRYDHRLAAFLLRAYFPDRFRHATRDTRAPDEPPPPVEPPVAEAVARLAPVTPAEPHKLMPPERMANFIDGARGVADVNALYPLDEREPYERKRMEEPHPWSVEKRRRRHHRDAEREDREAAREARSGGAAGYGDEDDVASP